MDMLEPIWTKKMKLRSGPRTHRENSRLGTARTYRVGENPHVGASPRQPFAQAQQDPESAPSSGPPFGEIGTFIKELRSGGPSAKGLNSSYSQQPAQMKFGVTWDEVDLAKGEWTIPVKRMKSGKAHKIPLSNRAIAILQELGSVENSNSCLHAQWGNVEYGLS